MPDLSVATKPGTTYKVEWVGVPDREATTTSVRKQFTDGQITRSRKLEGMWWGDGGAYFVASFARTSDGSAGQHDGQVWFLDPLDDTIELKLWFAYTPGDQDSDPDGPDNITVSAYGGVIIAEDGDGKHTSSARPTAARCSSSPATSSPGDSEFAGPTFSHDKKTLFVSVQSPGPRLRDPGARSTSSAERPRYRSTANAAGAGSGAAATAAAAATTGSTSPAATAAAISASTASSAAKR